MDNTIVISADFSHPGGPILAGPSEDQLQPTTLRVADSDGAHLAAVKELGAKHSHATVIDHSFNDAAGWTTSRRQFRRKSK